MSRLSTWIVPQINNKQQVMPIEVEKATPIWTTFEDGSGSDPSSEASSLNIKGKMRFYIKVLNTVF